MTGGDRAAALRHLLGLIADRMFDLGDCITPVGPDERCGECVPCWVRNVSRAAAAVPDRASVGAEGSPDATIAPTEGAGELERLRNLEALLVERNDLRAERDALRDTVARIEQARQTMGGQVGHCEWGCVEAIDEALRGDA